ncbi:hypothetical protein H5410_052472 [Solanum commersonii]|uniref:Nuclear factor related to kappa-B-binding protein second winged helix domain-containing protein n=1 Tax=Solanum commersonii TaxID=4109 RepID=A0A9J5X346_SOLCO|nr:hypothetical protein H5410_052472 [Solanum commersonii]
MRECKKNTENKDEKNTYEDLSDNIVIRTIKILIQMVKVKESKAIKSLETIFPCCEEIRTYFYREEALRYEVFSRDFPFIITDGHESIVAPLKRCGGKPLKMIRQHHILKRNRPPHFTIICLERDATTR